MGVLMHQGQQYTGNGVGNMQTSDYDSDSSVFNAGGIKSYVTSAISGKADSSSLGDLAFIAKDGVSSTKFLQGDGTWQNPPAGGHTMLPVPAAAVDEAAIVSAVNTALNEGGTNDDVGSLNTIGTWSNTYVKKFVVRPTSQHPILTTGVGDWEDETTHAGWVQIADLKGISAKEHQITIIFDPATFSYVIPVLRGYKIEDYVEDNTKNYGLLCILFANEINSSDTVCGEVGIEIKIGREPVSYIIPT